MLTNKYFVHFVVTLCLLLPQFFFLSPRPIWGSITSQCSALCSDTEDGLWLRKCASKTPVRGICRDGGPLKVDIRQKATLTALSSTLVCGRSIPLGSFSVREHNLSASPSSAQIFTRSSSARSSAAAAASPSCSGLASLCYFDVNFASQCGWVSCGRCLRNELPEVHAGCFYIVEGAQRETTLGSVSELVGLMVPGGGCGGGVGMGGGGRYHAAAPGPQTDSAGQRRLSTASENRRRRAVFVCPYLLDV